MAEFSASFRGSIDRTPIELSGSRGITEMLGNGIIEFPVPSESSAIMDEVVESRDEMLRQYQSELTQLFASPWDIYFADDEGTMAQLSEIGLISIEVQDDFTVEIVLGADMLFASGSAALGAGQETIQSVAAVINRAYQPGDIIIIEGHTDSVPVSASSRFADNWELSSARARTVLIALQNATGLPGEAFMPRGMSEYHPIGDNGTVEGRAENRRVVIFIQASVTSDTSRFMPQGGAQGQPQITDETAGQ
jgi:chemotaxis protein MotB